MPSSGLVGYWPAAWLHVHEGDKVALPGDSITATIQWYDGWVAAMGAHLGTVSNLGHSSYRVSDLISVVSEVTATGANVVIIEAGVNDQALGTDLTAFGGQCASYLDSIKTGLPAAQLAWVNILCNGEQYPDPLNASVNAYNAKIATACASYGVQLIDVRPAQQAYEAANNTPPPGASSGILTSDGVHPNATGKTLMSNTALSRTMVHW